MSEPPEKVILNAVVQCRKYFTISCRGLCLNYLKRYLKHVFYQGRRNEGRAKGGNADGKGNFGLMNNSFNVVDINPQISSIQHYLSVR